MEHFQYGKQIGKFLDIENTQKRHRASKPIFLGLESEKSENRIPDLGFFEKYMNFAHQISVHNGSHTFPNELTMFRI